MAGLIDRNEPCFAISVTARIVGVHVQTLRYYERAGLIQPSRSKGKFRLYSQGDIERLRQIKRLTEELGLNLAGVEVFLRMSDRMAQMERQLDLMRRQLEERFGAVLENQDEGTDPERPGRAFEE